MDEAKGLSCFLDQGRECGPDCMAYMNPKPKGDLEGLQAGSCLLLVNAQRVGKHLVVIAKEMTDQSGSPFVNVPATAAR